MHHLRGPGRDLVVVERREDVLRIATVDPVAVAVEHEHIEPVGPRIDTARLARPRHATARGDQRAIRRCRELEPHFIGVDGALREMVPERQRSHHHLDEILPSRLEGG